MGSPDGSSPNQAHRTTIRRADWTKDAGTVRHLFRGYRNWLADHRDTAPSAASAVAAGLASIDRQIEELPGAYGPPRGEILLGFQRGEPVACGGLRELEPEIGEMKRLYVRADHRGPHFGRRLVDAVVRRAGELGYARLRVDTLPTMASAIEYYQAMGFRQIPPYWPHPVQGALFFECSVATSAESPGVD